MLFYSKFEDVLFCINILEPKKSFVPFHTLVPCQILKTNGGKLDT